MMIDYYTVHTLCCDYLNIEELLSDTTVLSINYNPNGVLVRASCGEVGKKPTYVEFEINFKRYD